MTNAQAPGNAPIPPHNPPVPELTVLYLHGNPVVKKIRHYRKMILGRIPRLKYLDDRASARESLLHALPATLSAAPLTPTLYSPPFNTQLHYYIQAPFSTTSAPALTSGTQRGSRAATAQPPQLSAMRSSACASKRSKTSCAIT